MSEAGRIAASATIVMRPKARRRGWPAPIAERLPADERPRPILVYFAELGAGDRDRFEQSVAERASDSAADWDEIGGGLLAERDRTRVEDLAQLGRRADY